MKNLKKKPLKRKYLEILYFLRCGICEWKDNKESDDSCNFKRMCYFCANVCHRDHSVIEDSVSKFDCQCDDCSNI